MGKSLNLNVNQGVITAISFQNTFYKWSEMFMFGKNVFFLGNVIFPTTLTMGNSQLYLKSKTVSLGNTGHSP